MSNLPVIAGAGFGLTRAERRVAKEIALTRAASSALAAREAAKITAVAEVADTALVAVAEVSSLEALLVMRTPHAARRLGYVADRASEAIANVVVQTGRAL
jgi:hypothetical protein